mgnify:CR=1 FL=1
MKRWTVWLTLALCVLAVLTLAGCGGNDKKVSGKPPRAVSVLFAESSESWRRNGLALRDTLEKDGFVVDLEFSRTADKQAEALLSAVKKKPITIIVGAVDSYALKDALAEAAKHEISVIAYDRLIMNSPHVSYYVGFDAKEIGRTQARAIERALHLKNAFGSDNIEIFAGDPKDRNAVLFYEGAMEILKPYMENGRIVVPSGETSFDRTATADWSVQNAKQRADRLLQNVYADGRPLSAVLSPNDTLAGAVRESLDASYSGPWPFITGLDADPEGVRAVAADRQGMTIDKPPSLPAQECLRLVRDIAARQAAAAKVKEYNGAVEVPAFYCRPIVIQKDNLESVHWTQP